MDFAKESDKEMPSSPEDLLEENHDLVEYLNVASLANLANVHKSEDGWHARGDPTEIAMQVFASRFNWNRSRWVTGTAPAWKQLAEFPFDSDVKRMSVLFEKTDSGERVVFCKGAVERILEACTSVHLKDGESAVRLDAETRQYTLDNMEAMASLGLRVLALASRPFADSFQENVEMNRANVEKDLTFRGLIGLYDPPRLESANSVRQCQTAGIVVHMVSNGSVPSIPLTSLNCAKLTGDHPGTARAIAADVGILPPKMNELGKEVADAMVMTASQFDKLSDDEIDQLPVLPLVIARCAPNTKVRMIDALHRRKAFAAMTGEYKHKLFAIYMLTSHRRWCE